ncbi:MAG TPA: hypothetical protein PK331_02335 [Gordonia sp. (in: high G+C Gram-positive bacteria)]|uniref:hypothetical protein n=1 Tax=unclassified Gordonia (in: high G+C Gram-positive bacteria) TaxID=2657482 RepID=UPI000FA88B30|nr:MULTISPECIES: hypothetical protein [unclassified Gordonia (in: high G+C Gram-positive bacteria)]RTL08806.1 MAG: hypothetical protein EKK62_05560 [Acidimicrobiia bacterium]HNP58614.1 hypothetical protein [Gordonia sp. (in: high G+C Gram-positive bacteria)]HRC49747.1 hypothetical protein [Gordonia sp. (in: high G+C Gram-positive bacteria)]
MENVELRGHRLAAPLTVEIACSAGSHPVTIETDWSVTLPFDLESERIASALAGVSHSCEHLAVQGGSVALAVLLRLRIKPYPIRFVGPGKWTIDPWTGLRTRFVSAVTAAHKLREPSDIGHFQELMQALLPEGPGGPPERWAEQARSIVAESDGIDIAWAAGVHPRRLVAAWAALGWPSAPPSVYTYLKFVYATPEQRSAIRKGLPPVGALSAAGRENRRALMLVNMLSRDPDFRELLATTATENPQPAQCLLHRALEQIFSPDNSDCSSTARPTDRNIHVVIRRGSRHMHHSGANDRALSMLLDLPFKDPIWDNVTEDVFATLYAIEHDTHMGGTLRPGRMTKLTHTWMHHYPESWSTNGVG